MTHTFSERAGKTIMRTGYRVLLLASLLAAPCGAAEPIRYRAPLLDAPPVIDGRIEEAEWRGAQRFDGFSDLQGRLVPRRARAWVGATRTHFFVAVQSELPPVGELLAKQERGNINIVHDDSVEIWVDPDPAADKGAAYQVLINPRDVIAYQPVPRGEVEPPSWEGPYTLKSVLDGTNWVIEVAIPLDTIAPGRAATDGEWGMSVCRNWKQPWVFSSTHGYGGRRGRFRFEEEGVAVQQRILKDPFERDLDLPVRLLNTGASPRRARVGVRLERNTMPDLTAEEVYTLEPGGTATHPFAHVEANSDGFVYTVEVADADSGEALFSRSLRWRERRERLWETVPVVRKPLELRYAHFPYRGRLRLVVDAGGLDPAARVESLRVDLRPAGAAEPVAGWSFPDIRPGAVSERVVEAPELDGAYELVLTAAGEGVPAEPLVEPLERKHYPWEGNPMGRSRTVYPPFEPITLEGRELRTVLRAHRLAESGFPEQITAGQPGREKPLLAGPVALEAVIDGRAVPVTAEAFEVTEQAGDVVRTRSDLSAGPLKITNRARWEYDGAVRYDLELQPTDGAVVEALTLTVPLRDDRAPYLHAMGDHLRNTITDHVPAGQGRVWDASSVTCLDMPERFCTYLFLGSPLRGLSWFAENDRGWLWDRETPNLELVRDGDVLALRVHLVNRPAAIAEPRRLSFGLLAAPVKPRVDGWRSRYTWGAYRHSILFTDINWLCGPGCCANVYPPDKDMYYWRMIARGNTRPLSPETLREVKERGGRMIDALDYVYYAQPTREVAHQTWARHVSHNLGGVRSDTTMIFYYNRAVWNAMDEYPTFVNEWSLGDLPTRQYVRRANEVKIVPSESYIDFALYWYARSFEVGRNRGAYWDNMFFKPSFNTEMTDAYVDPGTGKIVPATGVWAMRELVKRTFVMMSERQMRPVTMPHMTSTSILPVLAFATAQLDWEWDPQNMYRRPYMLIASNGELAGVIPQMLSGGPDPRRNAGILAVFELTSGGPSDNPEYARITNPLLPLKMHRKTEVYRHWDEGALPVRVDHADVPWIAYHLPGCETRVVLQSFVEEPLAGLAVRVDLAALKWADGVEVRDAETNEPMPLRDGALRVDLPARGTRSFVIAPPAGGGKEGT